MVGPPFRYPLPEFHRIHEIEAIHAYGSRREAIEFDACSEHSAILHKELVDIAIGQNLIDSIPGVKCRPLGDGTERNSLSWSLHVDQGCPKSQIGVVRIK